ncbi:MAG: DEAD/DEAH box helicase family protein [Lactococcus lactis]|uniref:DEAD/DEAH box helicase family protein n=1 Tax=Lactococcus lactis TaxID=1358 RepID=UPI0021B05F8A|nr:DEAD/DEAH box helicase family protein [Lactococcus lactis]MCT0044825.1 restriction endonuclease subunit R [Lactococcus lactis subsp. lactis]
MVKTKTTKKLTYPFLESIEREDRSLFSQNQGWILPSYISENMKHELRPYQVNALRYLHLSQDEADLPNFERKQLLFHMATGSGKTDLMAASILYMYKEHGFTNFMFLVNSNGVLAKTRENLINPNSSKYLFSDKIVIDNEVIHMEQVMTFPKTKAKNTIYLKLTSVQSLYNDLTTVRENAVTLSDFSKEKMVILADEAHHYSSNTKSADRQGKSWEDKIDAVRNAHPENIQLEFTATVETDKAEIYEKYKNKIIFKYDLAEFQRDRYSKKIFRIDANNDDEAKMLNAVLLSQFRKFIAGNMGISGFKPVILFKSNSIKISNVAEEKFIALIENLSVESLLEFLNKQGKLTNSATLETVYKYFSKEPAGKILEIQRDFVRENIINANDKDFLTAENAKALNTLESPDNPYRVVFAVAKLSEGWDVLNLYDIVRISEGASTTVTTTTQEAQLIGRGARYFPFEFEGEKAYQRRFDDVNWEAGSRVLLESLHYHTINEKAYIENLRKSLEKMDLQVEDDVAFEVFEAKLKAGFKRSKTYREGQLYYNKTEVVGDNVYQSLSDYGMTNKNVEIEFDRGTVERSYDSATLEFGTKNLYFPLNKEQIILKKAFARNPFWHFSQLKKWLPNLESISDLFGSSWFGEIKLAVKTTEATNQFNPKEKLEIVERYLNYVELTIKRNFVKERGTNVFVGKPLSEVVPVEYQKFVSKSFNGSTVQEKIAKYDVPDKFFSYDFAIVNGLEKSLIDYIRSFVDDISNKYEEVYLIRLDEQYAKFKLHGFTKEMQNYKGFIPDFVLYVNDGREMYQIFIEPKGEHLINRDFWKEQLLLGLNPESIKFEEVVSGISIVGTHFYTSANDGRDVKSDIQAILSR